MFEISRDSDARRLELFVRREDGHRFITADEGKVLVVNSIGEARLLIEALMEETMRLNMQEHDEDA